MPFSARLGGPYAGGTERGPVPVSGERERPSDAVRQHVQSDGDAYAAGRDITIYQGHQALPTTGRPGHPEVDAGIAAIHSTSDDYRPIGSGIVLDDLRILTCAHVIHDLEDTWVAFPKAEEDATEARRRVASVVRPDTPGPVKDLAILVLAEPVPAGV